MKIYNNRPINIQNINKNIKNSQVFSGNNYVQNQVTQFPSVYSQSVSQINSNLPIGYTKIAQIAVPGLEQKADIYRLANGQKVVICPKKGPTFVKTTYNVGSLNENENIRGISHYIEHNLFNGSKGLAPKEYDAKVSQMGGSTNASTFLASTDYYLQLQLLNDNSLEEAIRLNAAQTQYPTFPYEQLEKEKEPVKSEIDVYKDRPDCAAQNIVLKNLFGIKSPSYDLTLGTKDNINSLTKETVQDYFDTWYTPDNAITVITGDVNPDETINLVSKYFNKQNNYSKVNQRYYYPIEYLQQTKRVDVVMPNSSNSNITMGFAVPENTSEYDNVKLETLLALLTADGSRLSKALDKYGVKIYSEMFDIQNKPNAAKAVILNISSPEDKLEEVLGIIYREISYIANYPPSFEELNNVKNKKNYELNSVSDSSGVLNSVLTDAFKYNNSDYFNQKTGMINAVNPFEISDTARRFLDLNKTSICVSHSKNLTAINSGAQNVSFGRKVDVASSLLQDAQKVKEFILPNNMLTKFVPCSSNVKSSFIMHFQTDELNDVSYPAFKILSELLNRGSAYKSNDIMTSIKNSKNMDIKFDANENGLAVETSFYPANTNDALALVKEVINCPNFTQQEFERAKNNIRNMIQSEPKSQYDKLMYDIFPDLKVFATKEDRLNALESLTLADIQNLYARIMQTCQVQTTISAPVEENPMFYDIYNSDLSIGLPLYRPVTKIKSPSFNVYRPIENSRILKEVENNAQANITQAYTYKDSQNIDDIAKIKLLDTILGSGGMSSRLFLDLREKEKLAYSVASSQFTIKDTGVIALNIATTTQSPDPKEGSPENVTKAIQGFERNVNALKTSYVSQEELDNAKTILKTVILNELETASAKNSAFHSVEISPYDNFYFEELVKAIDKVSVEDIKSAANYVFKNPPITSVLASQSTFDALNM